MKAPFTKFRIGQQAQSGVILVVCLVFLMVLTAMAIGGMETTIVEEKMAGNLQDQNRAFQAAEASMESAEAWLANQILLPKATNAEDGTDLVWRKSAVTLDGPWWLGKPASWWNSNSVHSVDLGNTVSSNPSYIIEEHHTSDQGNGLGMGGGGNPVTKRTMHRITGRGNGADSNTEALLQITYIRYYE